MEHEIELAADGEDLVVVGDGTSVERFLKGANLWESSTEIPRRTLRQVLALGADTANATADIVEKSGRYLKLTPESFADLKAAGGLLENKDGVRYAMLGDPGKVAKWLQVEGGAGAVLSNPAVLSGVGGLLTQFSQQAEAHELKALLVRIDEQLDDVRRAQRDVHLAKLDGAAAAITEAMIIRTAGGDPATLWAKVQAESGSILDVQSFALRAIDALADKVDGKRTAGALKKATAEVEREVAVWIAVLARCFELQDEFKILELDHVLATAPDKFDGHRQGVVNASETRRTLILQRTTQLMGRLDEAGSIARETMLLHAKAARAVVEALNSTGMLVDNFHAPLGIESSREVLSSPSWREALRDPQQRKVAGVEIVQKAAIAGGTLVAAAGSIAMARNNNSKGGT